MSRNYRTIGTISKDNCEIIAGNLFENKLNEQKKKRKFYVKRYIAEKKEKKTKKHIIFDMK